MPGGDPRAWPEVRNILEAIAAKTPDKKPCCLWLGNGGAGHYVKMIHNGIEYGDMQLICEAYQLLTQFLGCDYDEMHKIFSDWNTGELSSYLIETTSDIMAFRDENGSPLLEKILDTASQKGTGKWATSSSLDLGVPFSTISEAVYARCISALREQRVTASKILPGPEAGTFTGDKQAFIDDLRQALLASKIVSYAQGFMLLLEAANHYSWDFNLGDIALIWREGCIIRSVFLEKIKNAFEKNPQLSCLLLDDYFCEIIRNCQSAWRRVTAAAVTAGIPLPAHSSALAFYDSFRSDNLPANLIMAIRDYFGAHNYERVDKPRGEYFHTDWIGTGNKARAGSYTV
jgi:6-phosphogluconate dehydrogenase